MKRYFLLISVMAVAAIAACTKQPIDDIQPYEPSATSSYVYTVSASTLGTKSDYDAGGHFTWSAGDAISVLFHNGTDNKFFTLTTTGSGESASFSGVIDAGYEIGASDGTGSDLKIWALFPASANHSYAAGSNPTFYVQPSVDFSATYFSANIPMYALNAAEGTFTFANLASTYKFTVKNIKTGVDKVQFQIHNQTTHALSGAWPIHTDKYIDYDYATPASANSTLTYVSDVTSNQAVFYVSCRYWGDFEPVITITNCATGIPIKTFTANTVITPKSLTKVQQISLDVSGGDYYTPAINIDGNMTDWNPATNTALTAGTNYISVTGNTYYKELRVAYDSRYVYFYSKRNYNAELWTSDGYYYFYFDWNDTGTDELVFYLKPFVKDSVGEFATSPSSNITVNTKDVSAFTASCAGTYDATDIETEICISRTDLGIADDDVIRFASSGNKSASKVTAGSTLTFD